MACSLTYDDTLGRVRIDADSLCVTGGVFGPQVTDTFSRTVSSSWSSTDTGQTWSITGGSASEYNVGSGIGTHNVTVEGFFNTTYLNYGQSDVDVTVSVATSKLVAGANQIIDVGGRFTDISNYYAARITIDTSQSVTFDVRRRVANVQTTISSVVTSFTHVAGTYYRVRLQVSGTAVRGKIWLATATEPSAWTVEGTDSALTTGNLVALRSFLSVGTTNEPVLFGYDNLTTNVVGSAIVDRTTDGVTYTTVRGASDIGITTGCELERIVDDYEFPVGELTTYRVRGRYEDGTVATTTTCQIEVDLDQVWLKSIGRPFLNRPIDCVLNPTPIVRRARNGINPIVNRSYPVAVTDLRSSREVPLQLVTQTTQERQDLDLLLASGDPVFVQTPLAYPLPTMYAVIGDTAEARPVRNRRCDNDWRLWDLPLTEVAAPGPDVVGSTSTWQTVINTYTTWADVMTAHSSWASVLELIGDGSEVIVP